MFLFGCLTASSAALVSLSLWAETSAPVLLALAALLGAGIAPIYANIMTWLEQVRAVTSQKDLKRKNMFLLKK